eukprot:g12144.t1
MSQMETAVPIAVDGSLQAEVAKRQAAEARVQELEALVARLQSRVATLEGRPQPKGARRSGALQARKEHIEVADNDEDDSIDRAIRTYLENNPDFPVSALHLLVAGKDICCSHQRQVDPESRSKLLCLW